jgi:predicted dithiol-disulfide oxidoreductase (DUF899 family)
MFGPDYTAGCPACSTMAEGFNGFAVHLANHDVTLTAVSRAPLKKLHAYKRRMGWTFPWVSSLGSDFNFDLNVWFTEEQQREGGIEYNYRREAPAREPSLAGKTARKLRSRRSQGPVAEIAAMTGTDVATYTLVLGDGVVYHTYSTYARGPGSGECISGSTALPKDAMRRHSEFAVMTSTISAESSHECPGITRIPKGYQKVELMK